MTKEYIKRIQDASFFMGMIGKAIAFLQNTDNLYVVSDYSVQERTYNEEAIPIPKELTEEFKQRLVSYYAEEYNKYVKELKAIEL